MVVDRKAARRTAILSARRSLPAELHATEAEHLCRHVGAAVRGARTVCAYVPVGTEPGSTALLDRLLELCDLVLLPVVHIGPDGEPDALQWGSYTPGTLVGARWGLHEPPDPRLPADAIAEAGVVLVPALAVDRAGVRLGRGGGFYDRSLALCRPGTRLVAVVRDDEVVDELPSEPHDVRMTHALTPGSGVVPLGVVPLGVVPLGVMQLGNRAAADGGSST